MENKEQSKSGVNDNAAEANTVIKQGDVLEESEGWRFAPEDNPSERKRLTKIPPQAAQKPESMEIDLEPFANKRIRVGGDHNHSDWVYRARIIED
jgi:hypothetical protein